MHLQTLQDFLKVQSIFSRISISNTKYPKLQKIPMDLHTFQDFLKFPTIYLEFLQAIQRLPRFRLFSYEFKRTPGLPECAKYFSRISTSQTKSSKLQNIFLWIYIPGLPEGPNYISRFSKSQRKSSIFQNIFL